MTTNPFFVPTQYGAEDACKLLGCSYQWTGSENSNVNEMVNAFNTAITGGADGIAIALVDAKAFNAADRRGAEGEDPGRLATTPTRLQNARLSYIGQDLFVSGQEMGKHIAELVPSGDVALFIATPGQANIQPRIDGAKDTLKSHSGIKSHVITTGAAVPAELSVIDSYATAHPDTKGYFAVDAGSTQGLAQTIQKHNLRNKGVKGGGYDLTPVTQKLLADDQIDFTIDQQPYLQGFLPVLQLYMYKVSHRTVGHRRRQHRPEVPRQDHGRPLQRHQEPLRGHVVRARRDQGPAPRPCRHERHSHRRRRPGNRSAADAVLAEPRAAPARGARARAALPDAARGQHRRRHAAGDHLLHGEDRPRSSPMRTSSRCCRTSPRSRSSRRARCC